MNDLNKLAHTYGTLAEQEALAKVAPHVKPMKLMILEAHCEAGKKGLIPEEFPGLINTVRRRFTDLKIEGKIRHSGEYRKNEDGNNVGVTVLGADPNLKKYKVCAHCHGRGKTEIIPEDESRQPRLL